MAKRCKEELLTLLGKYVRKESCFGNCYYKLLSMCGWWCSVCFLHFLEWLVFVGDLLHNFLSCNSNECLPPRPQLLWKGRIYCCWTCTQADHKSGRCFLFLAHWKFYWLLYFFSLHFFLFPWKSELDAVKGKMLSLGIQNFVSHHLLLSWWNRVLERLVKLMVLERGCAMEGY